MEPLASCGYRYRLFDLSLNEEEDIKIVVRTEVDAYQPSTGKGDNGLMTIRTLNEFDSRAPGAGGAPDWRSKLDSQRGAVVATEMKNNSCKLAKWAAQSILAGAETMKVGCVLSYYITTNSGLNEGYTDMSPVPILVITLAMSFSALQL